ncbi:tyrosine-type recombinase/integrase [Streptomyces lunaelactis]|uniref:site-specific integrase n=1 Tax=Streptomyces lunaelactis TaxID=1535768 RepID=UPI00158527E8|nr:site-specific integrase [Streptomyces lunaelactis]NUK37327.1 tyrosine-type recombinase/integrase [Streptomyces lunaelactis]NUK43365.1 tyrosine-type recombinase/integrase [Streptomyces lunaelactis]NUK94687.1 tyrosine-type recombinase/integrase [Streptomyces lunaelactis]NUL33546.1 tyrosine-type recombinase/integrase [Streptomyces lunaelactis]
MTKRRSRGDGGLHWDDKRGRWIATVSLGYDGRGKRIVKRGSGRTKTEAKARLKEVLRDYEDGLAIAPSGYTVKHAVDAWLAYGLPGLDTTTVDKYTILCHTHLVPALGALKLRDLTADDVDKWLADKAKELSTSTLQVIRSCLNRAVKRAMVRDKVKRNVVELCSVPTGRPGRPSKALTLAQAEAVLTSAAGTPMYAYIVVSLLTGGRTEELRPLTWDHVYLEGAPDTNPPTPPHIAVWRSVRTSGDTKTRQSRRTLALPARCVEVLTGHREAQDRLRAKAGEHWKEQGLVFTSGVGTELDAANVRRAYRRVLSSVDGLDPGDWTPRELRHSFVSLLSDSGVPLEEISRLVGHSSTAVTEKVYRKQIRPVIQTGAVAMDRIFENDGDR